MKKEKKRYYAVVSGRVAEATIFSSWGDAHPYITGCHSIFEGFVTLSEAQKYLNAKGIDKPRLVIHECPKETRPQFSRGKFYAVALGRKPGVYLSWEDAEPQVNGYPHACYQCFTTRAQAQAFISNWKESDADVRRRDNVTQPAGCLRPSDSESSFHDLQPRQREDLSEWITTEMRNLHITGSKEDKL
ncbi:hypothetical protein BO82DRAFT_357647 [Aspergillus uvarum CBS 121591]|uniref:Ribonuclease H n=1 Tax=Aspergillus uvarum CBS 121591 TaxID=1448315 RepID=A0A319C2J2_9EURO|nr:hypothetical protein BO82DRAFT_357647 [Aspergillus uvarum CBS 121591]PYH78050.1 hypothetical protein BO82DRAFT_357647 [Aspergillus uvarum CBS 121591]